MTPAIIDITSHIVEGGKPRRMEIVEWLEENCGEYYGRGEGDVTHVGKGWEIRVIRDDINIDGEEYSRSRWVVDIDDGAVGLLFILRWV